MHSLWLDALGLALLQLARCQECQINLLSGNLQQAVTWGYLSSVDQPLAGWIDGHILPPMCFSKKSQGGNFPGSAKIKTPTGPKALQDVVHGDLVQVMHSNHTLSFQPVHTISTSQSSQNSSMVKITTRRSDTGEEKTVTVGALQPLLGCLLPPRSTWQAHEAEFRTYMDTFGVGDSTWTFDQLFEEYHKFFVGEFNDVAFMGQRFMAKVRYGAVYFLGPAAAPPTGFDAGMQASMDRVLDAEECVEFVFPGTALLGATSLLQVDAATGQLHRGYVVKVEPVVESSNVLIHANAENFQLVIDDFLVSELAFLPKTFDLHQWVEAANGTDEFPGNLSTPEEMFSYAASLRSIMGMLRVSHALYERFPLSVKVAWDRALVQGTNDANSSQRSSLMEAFESMGSALAPGSGEDWKVSFGELTLQEVMDIYFPLGATQYFVPLDLPLGLNSLLNGANDFTANTSFYDLLSPLAGIVSTISSSLSTSSGPTGSTGSSGSNDGTSTTSGSSLDSTSTSAASVGESPDAPGISTEIIATIVALVVVLAGVVACVAYFMCFKKKRQSGQDAQRSEVAV